MDRGAVAMGNPRYGFEKGRRSWRDFEVSPLAAAAIGASVGLMTGFMDGWLAPRDFSLFSLLAFVLFGAITGPYLWVAFNPEMHRRMMAITGMGGLVVVILLFISALTRMAGPQARSHLVVLVALVPLGFAAVAYIVGTVWGVILVGRCLVARLRSNDEPRHSSEKSGGLWDAELDY
jgi:hypothetical protein